MGKPLKRHCLERNFYESGEFCPSPEFTAGRLDDPAKTSNLPKTDPIIQEGGFIPAPQPDCKLTYLFDRQFDEVLDFLNQPAPTDVQEKLAVTMNKSYPWIRK